MRYRGTSWENIFVLVCLHTVTKIKHKENTIYQKNKTKQMYVCKLASSLTQVDICSCNSKNLFFKTNVTFINKDPFNTQYFTRETFSNNSISTKTIFSSNKLIFSWKGQGCFYGEKNTNIFYKFPHRTQLSNNSPLGRVKKEYA